MRERGLIACEKWKLEDEMIYREIKVTTLKLNKMSMCFDRMKYPSEYIRVESNARRLPSFPLDHLLTSASSISANLCKYALV
ncbi:hypothetical protein Leryth_023290 [Lithospermum erythrorhizon]|nr:hypothetical protein Leryth_023290 [Lithospermum erythrorhizon]